jgi:sulfite exporter TauE/SafE
MMKPLALVGVLLIVLGLAGLALGHFSFTTQKKVIDVGPVTASVAEEHSIAIPDVAGVMAIIAGAVMVVMGQRRGA